MAGMANMEFEVAKARTSAKGIDQRAKELSKELKQLEVNMNSCKSWWQGDSAEKFKAQYKKIAPEVEALIKCVTTISQQLSATADAKEKEEAALASELS